MYNATRELNQKQNVKYFKWKNLIIKMKYKVLSELEITHTAF
jgi:hypothetical protein